MLQYLGLMSTLYNCNGVSNVHLNDIFKFQSRVGPEKDYCGLQATALLTANGTVDLAKWEVSPIWVC